MGRTDPPRLKKFPAAKQRRLDDLLEKNAEGTITPKEKSRLIELVVHAEQLMVDNARILDQLSKAEGMDPPPGAVPVTVWVHPTVGKQ